MLYWSSQAVTRRIKGRDRSVNDDKGNILIIEDDQAIRENVQFMLEKDGFTVTAARTGEEGMVLFTPQIQLVILDIMMPGLSGFDVCKALRANSNVPILFLTARSAEADKVAGLELGGDDYVVKPFSYTELSARINAILRRHRIYDQYADAPPSPDDWLVLDRFGLKMHVVYNSVFLHGREIMLTETEYRILRLFMQHPGQVFSLADIYENVWEEPFLTSSANTVMVHMRNLRTKIEVKATHPQIIVTVWSKGYRLGG